MLVDIFLAITGAYLDISGRRGFPTWLWIALLGIAFIIAPFIVFHKLRIKRDEIQNELDSIKNEKPIIQVKAKVYGNRAILEVQNNGGKADFTARARVVQVILQPELYTMCWNSSPNASYPINKGDTASILVAEISTKTDESRNLFRGWLALFKIETLGQQTFGISTPEIVQQYNLNEMYPTMAITTPKDQCTIEITLTSNPPLREAFENHRYSIEVNHTGNELLFVDVSNPNESVPHKAGSQT